MELTAQAGSTTVVASIVPAGVQVRLARGAASVVDVHPVPWSTDIVRGVRLWARACLDDLSKDGPWSYWGRRAGRWTLLAEQMPTCAVWTAAYRLGSETITVAGGSVQPVESVRCVHGQRLVSEAVQRARTAVEAAVIEWIREVRRALCAAAGEASRSGVAA